MKKLISFSLFVTIVILVLVVKNTAIAHTTSPAVNPSVTVVGSMCPRAGYRWVKGIPPYRRMHARHYGHGRLARRMRLS